MNSLKRIGVKYIRIPDCADCIHFMKHDYKCRLFSKNISGKIEYELADDCRKGECTYLGIYFKNDWVPEKP